MNSRPARPRLSSLLLSVLFVALAAASWQCVPVDDQATAPATLSTQGASGRGVAACVQACNEIAKDARADEKQLHKDNKEACGDNQECLDAEEDRHDAAMEQIAFEMQECKRPCHSQGGGSGGQ